MDLKEIMSKPRGLIRRIDNEGRIVVPCEYRKEINIKSNDYMEIFLLKDDFILLKKVKMKEKTF